MIEEIELELLTATERAELIRTSEDRLTPSLVQYGAQRRPNEHLRRSANVRWWIDSPITLKLRTAVAELLEVDLERAEAVDVVRYEPGGFFGDHHDGAHRSATLLLCLSDEYEGGELVFPRLGLQVSLTAGHSVLWPNTSPETIHRSEPISSGQKWVAVVWISLDPRENLAASK